MNFNFAVDPACPETRRKAFFDALRDPLVRRLANEAAQIAAQLSTDFGQLAETRQAVLLAEATGASVADCLRTRIDDLRSQRTGMKRHIADIERYVTEQRECFRDELRRCSAMLLDGPRKVEDLRVKVRTYEQERAKMVERLREAGLDAEAIQRAGVRPDADDLAEWACEIEAAERDVRIAREFIASGPLFDLSLLNGMRNV
ncbi:hypothetical protein [Burkholderia ubonensis]|uniref:Uncharacterized protein n=1 Tax=Burkholderia ubonensis TaxID=101571 RepID=A0AAW3NCL7_9BURK|nr:hypothetical protein [Burkholderia ubonensis]KVT56539.1 hypothetical protein WK53_31800 [Burkholderia ubonensis]